MPTVALLKHVANVCVDTRMLLMATFRTTAPDRSAELSERLADLHRLEGVHRLDLGGLDTDAIAEFVSDRGRHPVVRSPGRRRDPARPHRRKPVLPAVSSGPTWNVAAASSRSAAANTSPPRSATP